MAPDLNSVPPSPRPVASSPHLTSRTASRRASQQMGPPPLPPSSPSYNILPSNQNAVNQPSSPVASPATTLALTTATADHSGVGTGPGPLRHPRPMTAADLHLELEKEQEAVVNRLTRELSMLRAAQNASVVSNTSSTSAGLPDSADHNTNHLLSGPSHPIPSQRRHHRSSSSTSARSITGGISTTVGQIAGSASGVAPDRSRGTHPRHESIPQPLSLSRQNSVSGSRRSGASSPAPLSSTHSSYQQHGDHFQHLYQSRPHPMNREPSSSGTVPQWGMGDPTSVQTTGRYEETNHHRHELETVKRENEALKRKVRDLERTLRVRRQSDASRTRSESVSTTASVGPRDSTSAIAIAIAIARGTEPDRERDGDLQA